MTELSRQSTSTSGGELGAGVDARHGAGAGAARAPGDVSPAAAARARRPGYALVAVCSEQGRSCPASGSRCESSACIDVGCVALDEDEERVA